MTDEGETASDVASALRTLADSLITAGEQMSRSTEGLSEDERADGQRAVIRGLNNQLSRLEADREDPELDGFNGWRHKMLMDNPDFTYWVADIRDDRTYRIVGSMGDAAYLSITVYGARGTLDARASSRIDSDSLDLDEEGRFTVVLVPTGGRGTVDADPITVRDDETGDGEPVETDHAGSRPVDELTLPEGASVVWLRQFHHPGDDLDTVDPRIEVIDPPVPAQERGFIESERLVRRLNRVARSVESLPSIIDMATATDREAPNTVRHWTEMAGGAAFTEPGIHYLRGSWQLESGEALILAGTVPPGRYWNLLLYSRFLNSLDHRHRRVSITDRTARLVDGRYRIAIAATDPGGEFDWLDSEGRPFGLFVFRFLQPEHEPELPELRVCALDGPERHDRISARSSVEEGS